MQETVRNITGFPCERCFQPNNIGEHGIGLCPYEPRPSGVTTIGDDIPGGMTVENMGHEPMTFYTKSAWRREMQARGLVNQVRHVGVNHTDKSPHTTRWV